MEAFQSDMSDMEQQQQAFLADADANGEAQAATSTGRWFTRPRLLGLALVAAVALSTATFVSETVATQATATAAAPVAVTGAGAGGLDLETIQAYSTATVGRMLTRAEAERVQQVLSKGQSQLPPKGMKFPSLRSLEDEEDEDEDPAWVSKECGQAMAKFDEDSLTKLMPVAVEEALACAKGNNTKKCHKAGEALQKVEEELLKECDKKGDVCKMLIVLPEEGKNESEEVCIPKACHKHATPAGAEATKEIKEERGCKKCSAAFYCDKKPVTNATNGTKPTKPPAKTK